MGLHLADAELRRTPLCPAGHLPLKGGDHSLRGLVQFCSVEGWAQPVERLISPLEGEMAGRPVGGAS